MSSRPLRITITMLVVGALVVGCDADTDDPVDVEDDNIQVDGTGPPATDTRGTNAPATLPSGSDVPDTGPVIEPPLTVEE